MPASKTTVNEMTAIILQHLPLNKAVQLVGDLTKVSGSKSVTQTIKTLHIALKAKAK